MAALQSLGFQNEDSVPKEYLPFHTYFNSMVLSVYDNILGPTIIKVWLSGSASFPDLPVHPPPYSPPPYSPLSPIPVSIPDTNDTDKYTTSVQSDPPSIDQLLLVSSYVIKDEACREEKINGIETKFYALEKFDLIASSYVFRAPLRGGKMSLFAFYVTLPYKELSEFMSRYTLCEDKIRSLLKKQIINKMEERKYERPVKGLVGEQVEELLPDFTHKLHGLSQVMLSVRHDNIPPRISVEDTIFGFDNSKLRGWTDFVSEAITCHLQMGGFTVVFGEDREIIMKMLHTLALFLTPKERKMSRTVPLSKGESKRYIPNLFLQGYTKKPDGSLPFTLDYLWKSKFPSTVIDMDRNKIFTNETTVPVYLRRKNENIQNTSGYARTLDDLLPFEKGKASHIIKGFVRQMLLLPMTNGARDMFAVQFLRLLNLKAITACKYIEADISSGSSESTAVWHVKEEESLPRVNKDTLMKELGLGESLMDLSVILCFAEKTRPNSYKDVLGDPQKDIEHILTDLEFV